MLSCTKRLRKEYQALNPSEDENIQLKPDEVEALISTMCNRHII